MTKALAVKSDGTACVSGSSDRSVKLWDLRQLRCIATHIAHEDSVWAVCPTPDFTKVYTGSRDNRVFVTDLTNSSGADASVLLMTESTPILKLELTADERSLWVATTSSSLSCWPTLVSETEVKFREVAADQSLAPAGQPPLAPKPLATIEGEAVVMKCHPLNDSHRVLTEDTAGVVTLWDILMMRKLKVLGPVDFDEAVKQETTSAYVRTWCKVDHKLGALSVHLDAMSCFSAWLYGPQIEGSISLWCTVLSLPAAYTAYTAYCLPPTAYRLPPTAYRLLPIAYCLLNSSKFGGR